MTQKTLIDEFAMAALNGILQNQNLVEAIVASVIPPALTNVTFEDLLAIRAYQYGQAMMKERQRSMKNHLKSNYQWQRLKLICKKVRVIWSDKL